MQKRSLGILAAMLSGLFLVACNNADDKTTTNNDTSNMKKETPMDNKTSEEEGVMVGGSKMVPSKDIVDNAVNSKDHTTLVTAVQTAGLVETLKGAGPFTVFAPTNDAFGKLPAGTVESLLKPESKATLTKILTYHVVPGKFTSADLKDGQKLKTAEGQELTIGYKDGKWTVWDAKGGSANITIADVISSNGVTYVIDGVLMPK